MQKTVWRYGGFSSLIVAVFFCTTWLVYRINTPNFTNQAILNWIGIVLSLVFVTVGIKTFRDEVNHGQLWFSEGLKVGLLIALLPALTFGLLDVLYVKYINPSFFNQFYAHEISQMQAKHPATEWAARLKTIEKRRQFFGTAYGQFIVMTLSVFIVGTILTILSTLVLKRKVGGSKIKVAHPAY